MWSINNDNLKIPYFLQRGNWAASARLTFQHYFYRERYGFLIHPDIASNFDFESTSSTKEPIQICDFACGNGVWGMDIAHSFPNVKVTGLDVSSEQFPTKALCPPNLSLGTQDIFDEVPEQYNGKFDIVHVRLLSPGVLQPGAQVVALKHLVEMVKPGGWLQWQEACPPVWCEVDMTIDPPAELVDHATPFIQFAENKELRDVTSIKPLVKKKLLRTSTELALWTAEESLAGLSSRIKTEEARERGRKAVEKEKENVKNGTVLSINMIMSFGRRCKYDPVRR